VVHDSLLKEEFLSVGSENVEVKSESIRKKSNRLETNRKI